MDGSAPLASLPPPAALREVRLNGFPEALAEVRRHRVGDRGHRVPDPTPTGVFGAAKAGKPAYPLSYNGAGEGCSAPLRSPPEKLPLRQRSRLGVRPLPRGPNVLRAASRRMFSRWPPITAGRGRRLRVSLRSDRRAAWSVSPPLRRRSPRPPGRTLPVPEAGVESLSQTSDVWRYRFGSAACASVTLKSATRSASTAAA